MNLRSLVVLGLLLAPACTPGAEPAKPTASAPATDQGVAAGGGGRAAPCHPWGNVGFSLVVSTQGGRGDFLREYRFDDATGVVSVHDSDPFPNGKEEKIPRVIDRKLTLAAADHRAVTVDLITICPDAAALKEQCAPGGCSRLEVTSGGATVRVEDVKTVGRVMDRLERFFPEVRRQH